MADSKSHILLYHTENQRLAEQIKHDLSGGPYQFVDYAVSGNKLAVPLLQGVPTAESTIVWLITDNYLKSEAGMLGALQALRTWSDGGILMPVVADGQLKNPDGSLAKVPTSFERVSNIIQYMNFWQDYYLELRKEKRSNGDAALEVRIENTKLISSEIGEFLRCLRNLRWYTLDDFQAGAYRVFRLRNGAAEEAVLGLATPAPSMVLPPMPAPEKSLAELIQDSGDELIAENTDLNKGGTPAEDIEVPANLKEIPGIDQLMGRDAKLVPNFGLAEDDDEEDKELNSILQEMLQDEAGGQENHNEQDTIETDENVDIEDLYDDSPLPDPDEDMVLLNLVMEDDEEGLVLKADGNGHATPEEVLEHAVHFFDDGRIELGLEYLEKTVQVNPSDNTLRYYYAYALARYGENYGLAKGQLEVILAKDKEHVDALFLLGEISEGQGNPEDARLCFETVAALQPDFPEVQYRLGLLALEYYEGQEKEALAYFKNAIEHDPKNADAHYMFATLSLEQERDADTAMRHFKKTISLDSEHPFANYDLALLHFQRGDRSLAQAYYERAVVLNPELKTQQNDLAFGLLEQETPAGTVEVADTTHLPLPPVEDTNGQNGETQVSPVSEAVTETSEVEAAPVDETPTEAVEDHVPEPSLAFELPTTGHGEEPYVAPGLETEAAIMEAAAPVEVASLEAAEDNPATEPADELAHLTVEHTDLPEEQPVTAATAESPESDELAHLTVEHTDLPEEQPVTAATAESPESADVAGRVAVIISEAIGLAAVAATLPEEAIIQVPPLPETLEVAPEIEAAEALASEPLMVGPPMVEDEISLPEDVETAIEQIGTVTEPSSAAEFSATVPPTLEELLSTPIFHEIPAVASLSAPHSAPTTKTVLVSGATSGIGRATAELFARNGFRVIITGRREDRLDQLTAHFAETYQAEVLALPFDVRDLDAVKSFVENLPNAWQEVDILVNNAGLSRGLDPIHQGDIEHWETMIDTNIKGLLYLTRAIAPGMVARRRGHIINVCSTAGKEVYPGGNVYSATKFAVDALTKSMRLDLYAHNIRVGQVAPGHVEETEFARVRFDWDEDRAAKVYEGFQPLRAEDVAAAIYFMATQPPHVNIQDILMMGTQQAGANFIDRSGR